MGRVEISPSQNQNPWINCHKICRSWLGLWDNSTFQIGDSAFKGGHLGKRMKYNILWLLSFFVCCFIYFFSGMHRDQTLWRILTHNGSKDVESCKDVPFGAMNVEFSNLTPIGLQKRKNLAQNRQCQAKILKRESLSIYPWIIVLLSITSPNIDRSSKFISPPDSAVIA